MGRRREITCPTEAKAFIAECFACGYEVIGLHPDLKDEEWLFLANAAYREVKDLYDEKIAVEASGRSH